MKITVSVEHRFDRTPDGLTWTWTPYPYGSWEDHLRVFDSARVLARVRQVRSIAPGAKRADGPGVSIEAVPFYVGAWQYIRCLTAIRLTMARAETEAEAVLLRAPGHVASAFYSSLRRAMHPYGVEVIGDPYECFSPGAVSHPLRPYLRWQLTRGLRAQCKHACAVAYVTREALQRRYPAGRGALSTHYSDVELSPELESRAARRQKREKGTFSIVTVGSLEQRYKGVDVLIDAVKTCLRAGPDFTLTVIGGGKYKPELEARASEIAGRIRFTGQLEFNAVLAELEKADLFVLPSKTEGLPKALIEAMAMGLPCIASSVGGIPELLSPDALVTAGNSRMLAAAISAAAASRERLAEMSKRNIEIARLYRRELLSAKRLAFYRQLQEQTLANMPQRRRELKFAAL